MRLLACLRHLSTHLFNEPVHAAKARSREKGKKGGLHCSRETAREAAAAGGVVAASLRDCCEEAPRRRTREEGNSMRVSWPTSEASHLCAQPATDVACRTKGEKRREEPCDCADQIRLVPLTGTLRHRGGGKGKGHSTSFTIVTNNHVHRAYERPRAPLGSRSCRRKREKKKKFTRQRVRHESTIPLHTVNPSGDGHLQWKRGKKRKAHRKGTALHQPHGGDDVLSLSCPRAVSIAGDGEGRRKKKKKALVRDISPDPSTSSRDRPISPL